jgi:hypothetical protein
MGSYETEPTERHEEEYRMSQTAVGVLEGIEERAGGWHRFSISMPGKQYPLKLDTKHAETITAAREVIGKLATWEYTEKEADKINPHTNQPYINRYLEGVELGASDEAQAAAASSPSEISTAGGNSEQMTKADWEAKERRDFRSRAWAQAITASQHTALSDETAQQIYDRIHPLARLIFVDIVRNLTDDEERDDPYVPF